MGVLLARFNAKRTCLEELEMIEQKIYELEKYCKQTEIQLRRSSSRLVIYSVCASIILTTMFCFFSPVSVGDSCFYSLILITSPFIIVMLKKMMTWYYLRQINIHQDLLCQLKADKQCILDTIMEMETYKVARKILERFAPDQVMKSKKCTTYAEKNASSDEIIIEKMQTVRSVGTETDIVNHRANTGSQNNLLFTQQSSQNLQFISHLHFPRPRPILPEELGVFERLFEYLTRDGPNYRFALICSKCHGHNGMALSEEFQFLSYRCCYCLFYNQAKKQRPISPKIEIAKIKKSELTELFEEASDGSDVETNKTVTDNE